MAYKALYRKYRPEIFENVVGQNHIIKTLQNAISNNKVAHAYIFSGPRGTGKTTTAKLLAKALNCESIDNKPCNECANCLAINNSIHPDIVEIDAASNNGIDEVRDLIEKVKYAPIQGKYKVYIIDEVHMMTSGAFNALLKTLEEPPEHVVFILATTDVHKVLPTVLSRCQRFDFSKINFEDIKKRVIEILKLENISFEDNVPTLIAELADGGMRDALSILDQVVSYAGDEIKLQHIYDIYGMMSNQDMVEYLINLAKSKTKDVLNMIESYIGKGIDVKRLTYDLMVCLKDAIVYRATSDETLLERLNKENAEDILKYYSTDNALKVSEILNEARNNYRLSTNYRLFFELSSLKIIESLANNPNIFNENVTINMIEKNSSDSNVIVNNITNSLNENNENITNKNNSNKIPTTNIKEKASQYSLPKESEMISYSIEEYVNILCHGDKKFKENLLLRWPEIRKYIDNLNTRYVAQLLADSTIGVANKDFILLVYDFKILASRAKQLNNILLIKKFIKEIFELDVEIYVVERTTFIDMTKKFFELKQANKLPVLHDIPHLKNDLTNSINQDDIIDEVVDETIEIGKDLFGDMLKIE